MSNGINRPWYRNPVYLGVIIAIVAIVVTIILAIWQYSPPPSDFCISVNPMEGEVHQGGVITTAITIKGIQGYEHPVSLSARGLHSGIVVTFIPPIGGPTPSYTSTVTIDVDPTVPAGDYEIVKKGTGADGKEHSCNYTLTVKPSVTPSPPLTPSPSPTPTVTPTPTISPTLTPTISILNSHTSLHGGEDLSVTVRWNNIPVDWKLVVSLEESEADYTRLAERDESKIVSGSGEETFTLKVKPTTETHHHAKVCACFYEGADWKNLFEKKNIEVRP